MKAKKPEFEEQKHAVLNRSMNTKNTGGLKFMSSRLASKVNIKNEAESTGPIGSVLSANSDEKQAVTFKIERVVEAPSIPSN